MRRSLWRVVPAALLLCVALVHVHTASSGTISAADGSLSHAAPSGFAQAQISDASAFDDDDDDMPLNHIDEAEEADQHHSATITPASAGAAGAPAGAATAAAGAVSTDFDDDEVADLLADDDEFVGAEPLAAPSKGQQAKDKARQQQQKKQKKSKKPAGAGATPVSDPSEPTIGNVVNAPQSFFQPIGAYEYMGAALVLLYLCNYFYGSRVNRRIARDWEEAFVPILREQFALVGADMDGASAAAGHPLLDRESESCYKLYASGRRYAESALVSLSLVARQDLLSLALGLVDLAQRRDTMTIDVALDEDACPPMVFAVLRKKGAKKLIKGQTDLESIPTPKSSRLPALDKYVVLSELGAEVEVELLPERVVKTLQRGAVETHFLSMHVTDQATVALPFSLTKKTLRCTFLLPDDWKARAGASDDAPLDAVQTLTNLAMYMVDRIGELKLSPAARLRSETKRKKLAEQQHKASAKERQEAMMKRKEELRKKEADIIAADPNSEMARELLRKKEQREAKLLKKQKGSNIKVMR